MKNKLLLRLKKVWWLNVMTYNYKLNLSERNELKKAIKKEGRLFTFGHYLKSSFIFNGSEKGQKYWQDIENRI